MNYVYKVPAEFKSKNEKDEDVITPCYLQGEIHVDIAPYQERIKKIQSTNYKTLPDGTIVEREAMDRAGEVLIYTKSVITKVDVRSKKKDGIKFDKFDDLSCDEQGSIMINEISNIALKGARLGEN